MSQNRSTAVMENRNPLLDEVDDFPTPPWATRLFLAEILAPRVGDLSKKTAAEPACNRGYMARPLAEAFGNVITSDLVDYGWAGQQHVSDFIETPLPPCDGVDWIITNPPFAKGEAFVLKALSHAREGVAIIARTAFLEGRDRYVNLFRKFPPALIAPSSQRIPMQQGGYNPQGSTATSYTWFVWLKDHTGPSELLWTPEYRDRYQRPGDVNFEMRDASDWVSQTIANTPLFAHEGGR